VVNNNFPQITSVTSESLQAQIRALLPSQEGFGTDLMAQNVIVPIVDLTSAAEGSTVSQNLQTALAFGSQTAFEVNDATTTIANTTGFWRVTGVASGQARSSGIVNCYLNMSDGLSTKTVWGLTIDDGTQPASYNAVIDLTFFLAAGHSLIAVSNHVNGFLTGSLRQIADVNGNLVNPSGFNPQ